MAKNERAIDAALLWYSGPVAVLRSVSVPTGADHANGRDRQEVEFQEK